MVRSTCLACLLAMTSATRFGLTVVDCASSSASPWAFSSPTSGDGKLSLGSSLCLQPGGPREAHAQIVLASCSPESPSWTVTSAPGFPTIVLKDVQGDWGPAVLLGHVVVGQKVMLYSLSRRKGYCSAHNSCDFVYNATDKTIRNPETHLCLGSGPAPPPPPPPPPPPKPKPKPSLAYSCAAGEPLSQTAVCDRALGFRARARDLAGRLNLSDHVDLFFSYPGTPYIESLNVKSWSVLYKFVFLFFAFLFFLPFCFF